MVFVIFVPGEGRGMERGEEGGGGRKEGGDGRGERGGDNNFFEMSDRNNKNGIYISCNTK